MQNIPAELLLMISTHMSHHDLRALAITSQSFCRLLLPEYLRRRRLVLKGACVRGTSVELRDLSGYASLGLWSVAPTFHPPGEMYCSIPYDTQEARKAMGFLIRFLLEPSNTSNLRSFHFSLRSSNPLLLTSRLAQIQRLFCILPLTQLLISGYGSADYLPSSIILRSGASPGSRTLTSFIIFSDHAFDPGFARATMGILRHSPIRSLTICMVSLSASQWSTLLGELEMALLEDIEIEGDIPRPALIRFLVKHKGLRNIHIQGNVPSDRAQPSRSRGQHFLPNLLTLRAPLAICCDVIERTSDASSLYKLEVETSQLHPHDPLFLRLAEVLWSFQKLDHFGLRLEPSSPPVMPQDLGGCDWDEHPVCKLRKVRTLSFSQNKGRLSPRDIVCPHILLPCLLYLNQVTGHDVYLRAVTSDVGNRPRGRRRGQCQSGTPRLSTQSATHPPCCHCHFRSSLLEVENG